MAQKPFLMDAGIQCDDWHFTQDGDHLKLSYTALANVSQRPFRVDAGLKIGSMAWFASGDDFLAQEDDSSLTQRPYLVDAGFQIGEWVITQDSNLDIQIGVDATFTGGQASSSTQTSSGTTLTGGEAFATGWASTEWQTAADSATGNPRIIINVNYPSLDSDWVTALDNWSVGDSLVIKTPVQFEDTELTTTGNISSTVSGDWKQYYFDVDSAPSSSTYLYKVEHTTSSSSTTTEYDGGSSTSTETSSVDGGSSSDTGTSTIDGGDSTN